MSKKRPSTARKYGEDFRAYWLDQLSKRYKSIEEWLDSVKKAQFQPDFEVQTAWAKELESYITAKKISYKTRAKILTDFCNIIASTSEEIENSTSERGINNMS